MITHNSIAYKRKMRAKKIRRKKSLIAHHGFTWYDCDGKYDKGKIHCGCPLCKPTKRFHYPSFKDWKANEIMDAREKEELDG